MTIEAHVKWIEDLQFVSRAGKGPAVVIDPVADAVAAETGPAHRQARGPQPAGIHVAVTELSPVGDVRRLVFKADVRLNDGRIVCHGRRFQP